MLFRNRLLPLTFLCSIFAAFSSPSALLAQPPVEDLGRRSQTMLARIAASSPSLAVDWNDEGIRVLDVAGRVTVWDPSVGHPIRSRRVVPSRRPAPISATEAAARVRESVRSPEEDSLLRAFHFEGQWLALALEGFVTSWDLDTLERLGRYERPHEVLTAVAIDSAGRWLASGNGDGRLCLWSATVEEAERQCSTLSVEDGAIVALDFVGDGRLVVGQERKVTLGTVSVDPAGSPVGSMDGAIISHGPEGSGLRALTEAAGQVLVGWSGGEAGAGRIDTLALEGGEIVTSDLDGQLAGLVASRVGDRLAVLGTDGVSILGRGQGAAGWHQEAEILVAEPPTRALAFDPSGSRLALTDGDGQVSTWAVATGLRLRAMKAHGRRVASVRWANPQELWTVVPSRPAVYAWNVPENLATVWVDSDRLAAVGRGVPTTAVASPQGERVAIAFEEGGVALWDRRVLIDGGGPEASWDAHRGAVTAVAFASVAEGEDVVLLTAGEDGAIHRWQPTDGTALETPGGPAAWELDTAIRHLGPSPFERLVAVGTDQGVALHRLETGESLAAVSLGQPVFASRFVRRDELILAAGDGLYSWRVGTQSEKFQPEKFQDFGRGVRVFDFAPASRDLASAKASNGAVEVWTFEDDGRLTPIHLLLSGDRDRWIACEKEGTCRRNDDGTLLLDRERDEAYRATLPALGTTPGLEVVEANRQPGDDGIVTFEVTVSNQGPGPAAWVALRPSLPLDPDRFAASDTLPWLAEGLQTKLRAKAGPLSDEELSELEVEVIAATASARDGVVLAVSTTERRGIRWSAVLGVLLVLVGLLGYRLRR